MKTKSCNKCGEIKPSALFDTYRKKGRAYLHGECRPCRVASTRERRHAKGTMPRSLTQVHIDSTSGQRVKRCSKCGGVKPENAFCRSGDRRRTSCKACDADSRAMTYENNPAKARQKASRWAKANRPKINERVRQRKESNPEAAEAYRARWGEYYASHRAGLIEKAVRYVKGLSPEQKQRRDERARKSRVKSEQFRRAQKLAAGSQRLGLDDIIARDGLACYLCGKNPAKKPSIEHVIPLSRGGSHTLANVRVACCGCNSRKHNRLLSELDWYKGGGAA